MQRRFHRFKLLLDENMPIRSTFPRLNHRFDVKHIVADLKQIGLPDTAVYALACKHKRLLVTFNEKDFRDLAKHTKDSGIIGISANLSNEQIDKKLTSLLTKETPGSLFGKRTMITGES